jgi:hypothetical protein
LRWEPKGKEGFEMKYHMRWRGFNCDRIIGQEQVCPGVGMMIHFGIFWDGGDREFLHGSIYQDFASEVQQRYRVKYVSLKPSVESRQFITSMWIRLSWRKAGSQKQMLDRESCESLHLKNRHFRGIQRSFCNEETKSESEPGNEFHNSQERRELGMMVDIYVEFCRSDKDVGTVH